MSKQSRYLGKGGFMSKKIVVTTKKMVKIINGKQPNTIRIKEGYLNLLPGETTDISESSMTNDIVSKVRTGWLKIENFDISTEMSVEVASPAVIPTTTPSEKV